MILDRYVGLEYCPDTFDCADLVALVQREQFGRMVRLPNGRQRGDSAVQAFEGRVLEYGTPTDAPVDGDLVVMTHRGRPSHVGVYVVVNHMPHVLHVRAAGGWSELTPVHELATPVEGYYRWA